MTNPLDVIKTRLQTQQALPTERQYKGVTHAIAMITKEVCCRTTCGIVDVVILFIILQK